MILQPGYSTTCPQCGMKVHAHGGLSGGAHALYSLLLTSNACEVHHCYVEVHTTGKPRHALTGLQVAERAYPGMRFLFSREQIEQAEGSEYSEVRAQIAGLLGGTPHSEQQYPG